MVGKDCPPYEAFRHIERSEIYRRLPRRLRRLAMTMQIHHGDKQNQTTLNSTCFYKFFAILLAYFLRKDNDVRRYR